MAALQRQPSQPSKPTSEENDNEIPKLGIYAFIGVVFIAMPLMPTNKHGSFAKVIEVLYRRLGASGLLALPFGTLTAEKATYDSYCAYWGPSIYDDPDTTPKHGGFPSGGAALPSFSLIETRQREDRMKFRGPWLDSMWCMVRADDS